MNIKTQIKKIVGLSLKKYTETYLKATHNRIDNIVAQSGNDNSEIVDARIDIAGVKHTTIGNRISKESQYGNIITQKVEDSHISIDSLDSHMTNIEILGNTIQDPNNLADIQSVGDKIEGQELVKIPLLCTGKNLIDINAFEDNTIYYQDTGLKDANSSFKAWKIKVNPNTPMWLTNQTSSGTQVVMYKNKARVHGGFNLSGLINRDIDEIAISVSKSVINPILQLEEGTQSTPYEPYIEHKLTISSPCQIEKVGDVEDRIVERDGVWGVDKNITTRLLNGSENWTINGVGNTTIRFTCGKANNSWYDLLEKTDIIMSDMLVKRNSDWNTDIEGVENGTNSINIRLSKQKVSDLTTFKNELSKNNILIKYATTTPQFIPLPHSQQVKLRTFANKTNISFLTKIEGKVKGNVAKSKDAVINTHTTQIDNLNKELEKVKKLEESTVSIVKNEGKDFVSVAETNGGYFEDVRLEGRTLVNAINEKPAIYSDGNHKSEIINGYHKLTMTKDTALQFKLAKTDTLNLFKPNTLYTFVVEVKTNTINASEGLRCNTSLGSILTNGGISQKNVNFTDVGKVGIFVTKFVTEPNITIQNINMKIDACANGGIFEYRMVALEGDHTQAPPDYFEGLKSVGEGTDEIVVSSVWGEGNLFDDSYYIGKQIVNGQSFTPKDLYVPIRLYDDIVKIFVYDNQNINITTSNLAIRLYDADKNALGFYGLNSIISSSIQISTKGIDYKKIRYCNVFWNNLVTGATIGGILVSHRSNTYTPHKADKKRLLRHNTETQTWEKPILREWDYVEKRADGKYWNVEKSGQVVLNGSENCVITHTGTTCIRFKFEIKFETNLHVNDANWRICNLFKSLPWISSIQTNLDNEYVSCAGGYLIEISILKSKLTSPDVAGFKALLKKWSDEGNPCTVTYQTSTTKEYECTNIDLITYPNTTNLTLESGVLCPNLTANYNHNIGNIVNTIMRKVSTLETNLTVVGDNAISSKTQINDSTTNITSAWSSNKTKTEIDKKSNITHTHTKANISDFAHRHSVDDIDGLDGSGNITNAIDVIYSKNGCNNVSDALDKLFLDINSSKSALCSELINNINKL